MDIYPCILPSDFNIKIYKELNNDLQDMDENELLLHYINYGINENRLYKYDLPKDFNIKIYKEFNNDLNNMSDNELIIHYIKHGINENRIYNYSKKNREYINNVIYKNNNIIDNITNSNNNYNIYLINLINRIDRKDNFINNNIIKSLFNVYMFNAIKHNKGWMGCSLSHLKLIYYAKNNNLPYIIISEDDTIFLKDYDYIDSILLSLINNLDKWEIFNGNPTFTNINLLKCTKNSINDNLINISCGLTTNFIIYNKNIYDKMLKYNFINPIDLYISNNFIQTTSKKYISSQGCFFSDIENKIIDYNNYILDNELALSNKLE